MKAYAGAPQQVQKYCSNVTFQAYEKNSDVGGTWLENRYPGAACDVPSHAYTFNFALYPDWPAFFSYSPDIWAYLDKVCNTFGLRKYMQFNTEVAGCWWQEDKGKWKVLLRETVDGRNHREFEDECDFLVHASGILNNYKLPNLSGMSGFKGRIVHTAHWPNDYKAEQWKEDRVAVIGSGASSIQTVPQMQKHAKHIDIFVRTPVWFVELGGHRGDNTFYTDQQKAELRENPDSLIQLAKKYEDGANNVWGAFYEGSEAQAYITNLYKERMKEFLKDERLLKGFTPKFGVGCRRITPGDPYMAAVQQPNVDVHFTAVEHFTENGIVGADGVERECDTVVCATGFDVSYRPRFPLVGKNGIDLAEKWQDVPDSYLGLAVPDFPNLLIYAGPTFPVENGSVIGPLLGVSEYLIQMLKKMQGENIKSIMPKQDVTDLYNEHTQEWIKHTIWKDDCRSWYKNNETGRVNAVFPGSSLHYMRVIETPRYEDYEIKYANSRNLWAFMGMGCAPEDTEEGKRQKLDTSAYLAKQNFDPKWLESLGKN